MRVTRVGAAGLALAAAAFLACAARQATAPDEDAPGRTINVPHGCAGAEIRVQWPDIVRSLELLIPRKTPEPETPVPEIEERRPPPTGEETANAVMNAIESAVPEIQCRPENHYYRALRCSEKDLCRTSIEAAQAYVERIRAVVTPAVEVSALSCACRIYGG
jgi:hypothetical protein